MKRILFVLLVISIMIAACGPSASATPFTLPDPVKTFCVLNPWGQMTPDYMSLTAIQSYRLDVHSSSSTTKREWVSVERVEPQPATTTEWAPPPDHIAQIMMLDTQINLGCGGVNMGLGVRQGDTFEITIIAGDGLVKEVSRWTLNDNGRWYAVDPGRYLHGKTQCEDNDYYVAKENVPVTMSSEVETSLSSDLAPMAAIENGLTIFCDSGPGQLVWGETNALVTVTNATNWYPWIMQERWYLHDNGASRAYYWTP